MAQIWNEVVRLMPVIENRETQAEIESKDRQTNRQGRTRCRTKKARKGEEQEATRQRKERSRDANLLHS